MKVWVVTKGVCSDVWIPGVYATAEAAILAHPRGTWKKLGDGCFRNDLDGGDACSAMCYEVKE